AQERAAKPSNPLCLDRPAGIAYVSEVLPVPPALRPSPVPHPNCGDASVKSIRPLMAAALAVLLAAMPAFAADKKKKKTTKDEAVPVVAHVKLSGTLDEAPTPSDPLFGSLSENIKAKLDRIAKAKKDANVKALILEIEDLSIGWGKVDELRHAI